MKPFCVIAAFLLLFFTYSFAQTEHPWQVNLQGRIGPKITPYKKGDGKIEKQFLFDVGIDRNINALLGLGITMSYVDLQDENGLIRYTGHNITTMSFNYFYVDSKLNTEAYSIKFSPYIKSPLTPKSTIYLRLGAGIARLKSEQQIIYDINDQGANQKIIDLYDYDAEWMTTLGLSGEYALRFYSRWEAFASLGYEKFTPANNSTRYTFDNTEAPLSSFPKNWQADVTRTRGNQNESDNDPHNFGEFQFIQLGIGLRIRFGR